MDGILSKGIKLSHKGSGSSYTEIPGLQEIPDIGGETEKVDVTTLADGVKKYINGIKDFGDLAFKFLYDNATASSSYRIMEGFEKAGTSVDFKLDFPDGTSFAFSAQVSNKIDSVGVNAPLTFTSTLALNSDIVPTHPGE